MPMPMPLPAGMAQTMPLPTNSQSKMTAPKQDQSVAQQSNPFQAMNITAKTFVPQAAKNQDPLAVQQSV